jgi:hypothetical protein
MKKINSVDRNHFVWANGGYSVALNNHVAIGEKLDGLQHKNW